MMKKKFILLFLLLCSLTLQAQKGNMDKELSYLIGIVKMLRVQNAANFDKALQQLKSDYLWTPMCETGEIRKTECKPADKVRGFKLNRIMTNALKERKHVSTKDEMLNGEDSRYKYSLYERSLKGNSKATYTLNKRYGNQTLVVVPFNGQKGSLSMEVNSRAIASTQEGEDGTLVCYFEANAQPLSLTIENHSKTPMSFVILNHNSRNK